MELLCLPNETLLQILRNLHYVDNKFNEHGQKSGILATRAVCRRLAQVGARIAFRHVKITQDQAGYQRLHALSNSIHGKSIHFLTYSFVDFDNSAAYEDKFLDDVDSGQDAVHISRMGWQRFGVHGNDSIHHSLPRKCSLDVDQLSVVFSRLENLESIRLSHIITRTPSNWVNKSLTPDWPKNSEHPASLRVLDTISAALHAAGSKVKVLTLLSSPFGQPWPIVGLIQSLSSSKALLYRQGLSHLQVLHVHLPPGNVAYSKNFEGLSGFISSLPALEELVITGDSEGHLTELCRPLFLSDLHIPLLKSLQMTNVAFAYAPQLTRFLLRHSESLRRVSLHHASLLAGSWENVVDRMKGTMNLSLDKIYGGYFIHASIEYHSL